MLYQWSVHLVHRLIYPYFLLVVVVVDVATGETTPPSPGVTFLITAKMSPPPKTYPHNVKYILMHCLHCRACMWETQPL